MNSTNAKDYLPLVQALAEGRVIQQLDRGLIKWIDIDDVKFMHEACCYRIKPEPREVWVNEYKGFAAEYAYDSEKAASDNLADGGVTRRYREVIE